MNLVLNVFRVSRPPSLVILMYHEVTKNQRVNFGRQMDELLQVSNSIIIDFHRPLNHRQHYIAVTFDDGFQCILENALPELERRKIPAILFIPTGSLGKSPEFVLNDYRYRNEIIMTSEQLKYLPSSLVTIGSHTVTHPHLTHLSKENIRKELIESKNRLEKILNMQIELLAFPHGEYNQSILNIAKQAGYRRVFVTVPMIKSNRFGDFLLGRISVSPDDWFIEFKLKLMGAYQWLPIGILLKQKYYRLLQRILKRS